MMRTVERAGRVGAALLLIAACAPRTAPAAARGDACVRQDAGAVRSYVVADPPGLATLGADPFTAVCRFPAEAAAALRSAGPGAAMLYVEGVTAPRDRAVTVNVYLGGDGARGGSFTLLADEGAGGPGRVPVPIGDVLGGALGPDGELTITLRAVDTSNPSTPPASFSFDRMVIELP